jgi:hypothetical protein
MPAAAEAILIGTPQLASAVSASPAVAGRDVVTFPEHQVREAVEVIVRRRPETVVISVQFAMSPRGTALTHRVSIDPHLSQTKVWIVHPDGRFEPFDAETKPSWLPLDTSGTRRVPRIRLRSGVSVQIDGASAELVDLSTKGAQVVSPTVLKPNQRVRILIPVEAEAARAVGIVAWASFELPKGAPEPRYRAGLEFSMANPELLLRLCLAEADEGKPAHGR